MKARIVTFGTCKVSSKDSVIAHWFCLNNQCKPATSRAHLSS
jgi:hypothetical protein